MKPHYERIRKVKTRSGATAIQVGRYEGKRFRLTKHIGSAHETPEIAKLITAAKEHIRAHALQPELDFNPRSDEVLFKRGIAIEKSTLTDAFTYLSRIYAAIGFTTLNCDILMHFAIIRVLEPVSKAKSIVLLQKYFDINYKKTTVFRRLAGLTAYKEEVTAIAIRYAKDHRRFDYALVFYDVTTLYFETFATDELRRNGFSKDNKPHQPQILIGLVVDRTGFPIYYDIFKGNTFEGKTIIPVITALKERHNIERFTVVADAGMLSAENLSDLEKQRIDYVVGARIGALNLDEIRSIAAELGKTDKQIVRHGAVLYEYSKTRAGKDAADNNRAIAKAEYYLKNPANVLSRSKFLANKGKKSFVLNERLIEKQRLLEGIKGYKTNITDVSGELLVARYKDLWKIEQAFRIAKSDLQARPVYHRKEISIQYHILIVFVALCMARVIERDKGVAVKQVIDGLRDRWTITIRDAISGNSLNVVLDKKPH